MKMSLGYCYMLLLFFAFIAVVSGAVVDMTKKVGDKALFKPDIPAATSLKDSSITWKYAAGSDVIKVIEWDNDFETEESLNPKFKSRVALDRNTGELTIRDLQLEHTGLYTIEINNKEQEKKIKMTVMEGVTKPKLTREETSNPDAVMYLTCKYNATIRWSCTGGKNWNITKQEKPKGESLTFIRAEMQGVCCTCALYNDVSEETSDPVCEKDLFTGAEEKRRKAEEENLSKSRESGNVRGILTGVIVFILIILLIVILIFLCVKSIHDWVYNSCKGVPCVGGIVTCFHGISRFRNETSATDLQGSPNTKQGRANQKESQKELLEENPFENDK